MSEKLMTPYFRVSYPYVFEPRINDKGTKEWTMQMIFDVERLSKDKTQAELFKGLRQAVKDCVIEKFGEKVWKEKTFKSPFKDGADRDDKDVYPEGSIFIESKTTNRAPKIIDKDKVEILDDEEFYPGCYAHATVSVYSWTYGKSRKGVSFGLSAIQKVRNGDRLGGGSSGADFDAVADDDIENNFDDLFGDVATSNTNTDIDDLM